MSNKLMLNFLIVLGKTPKIQILNLLFSIRVQVSHSGS